MEYISWNNTNDQRRLSSAELIPVIALAIESFLGVACNLTAAAIYWQQKRGLFQNPGNIFTVSLILDDLILSGVAIPLVLTVEMIDRSGSAIAINYLCLGARCTLLFSAVSSATGSAMLALDRVDITLRPSNRFFRPNRAETSVAVVWFFSILSLLVPVWTTLSFDRERAESRNQTVYVNAQLFLSEQFQYASEDWSKSSYIQCDATCSFNRCSVTKNEFIVSTTIQFSFFVCAAIVVMATYSKILRSVKKRDVKRENIQMNSGSYTSNKKRKFYFINHCNCGHDENEESAPLKTSLNTGIAQANQTASNYSLSSAKTKENHAPQGSVATKSFGNKESKKFQIQSNIQDKKSKSPDASFEKQVDLHPGRANFASVALSIQAFIALKRIVKEKAEVKKKKYRHLRRMTIAITLTFLVFWTPFHIFPFVRILVGEIQNKSGTCTLIECLGIEDTDINKTTIFIKQSSHALNVAFLWVFALASLSSIANPYFYSFSRQKIREEACKTFCKSKNGFICKHSKSEKCCKTATASQHNQRNAIRQTRKKTTRCDEI